MPPCANSWRNCSIGRNHPSLWFRDRQDAIKSSKFRTSPCRKPQPSSEINKSPQKRTSALPSQRQPENKNTRNTPSTHPYQRSVQPLRFHRKGDQKFRERGEREGRRTAFQSGFRLSHKTTSKTHMEYTLNLSIPKERPAFAIPSQRRSEVSGKRGARGEKNRFSKRFSPLAQKHIQQKIPRDAKKHPYNPFTASRKLFRRFQRVS